MNRYSIHFSEQAMNDMASVEHFIRCDCYAPSTAKKYIHQLYRTIQRLESSAEMFAIVPKLSLQLQLQVRRVNCRKLAIIYSVEGRDVYIHRILPQSLVIY